MAELELEGLAAERLAEELVAEADAEDGNAGVHERLHLAHDVVERGGVAGAVAQEDAGGLVLERVGGAGGCGDDLHFETGLPQVARDVVFHPEVERDDGNVRRRERLAEVARVHLRSAPHHIELCALLVVRVPREGGLVRDFLDVVHADEDELFRALHRLGLGHARLSREKAVQRAAHAELLGERACINALDAGNTVLLKVVAERPIRAPVADDRRQLADDEARGVRPPRLDVLRVHAVVADERVGHRHDLALVGRVGENLLIPGHRGVETHLATGRRLRAKTRAVEH